jgi:hypothetical protein
VLNLMRGCDNPTPPLYTWRASALLSPIYHLHLHPIAPLDTPHSLWSSGRRSAALTLLVEGVLHSIDSFVRGTRAVENLLVVRELDDRLKSILDDDGPGNMYIVCTYHCTVSECGCTASG